MGAAVRSRHKTKVVKMNFKPLPKPARKVIVVANEKGGVGKTTIATNLASICANVGWNTLLFDVDPQQSSTKWANVRQEYGIEPSVSCVSRLGKCGADISRMAEHFGVVIVDSGGRDSIEMRQAMSVSDMVLMPVSTGQFEVWSVATMDTIMADVCARTGVELQGLAFLTKATSTIDSALNTSTHEQLSQLKNFKALPLEQSIVSRVSYQYAALSGRSVFEKLDRRDVKAEEEMRGLFSATFGMELELA